MTRLIVPVSSPSTHLDRRSPDDAGRLGRTAVLGLPKPIFGGGGFRKPGTIRVVKALPSEQSERRGRVREAGVRVFSIYSESI